MSVPRAAFCPRESNKARLNPFVLNLPLVVELQPDLDNPSRRRRADHPEVQLVAYVQVRVTQVHVIEAVERFDPELKLAGFGGPEAFEQGNIEIDRAGTDDHAF